MHAGLAGGGDRDPVAGQHVLPHGRGLGTRVEHAGVDGALGTEGRVGVVEVDQLAPVGEQRRDAADSG